MTHPEDLLAGYVDGTLADRERAVVDAHLPACETCREEVELSRAAIAALSSLEEVPVPFGVTGPVLAEAGKRFERRRAAAWGRVQWVAGAAAAAALVLVVALNLNLGDSQEETRSGTVAADAGATGSTGGAEAPEAAPAFAGLERQPEVSYDDAGVRSLAIDEAAGQRSSALTSAGGEGTQFADPAAAIACLRKAEAPVDEAATDQLVRLIEAKYQGTPAYLAVFLESPGGGQPPDRVVVWVVSKGDCEFLSGVQQNL
jgi:hypothetical protein